LFLNTPPIIREKLNLKWAIIDVKKELLSLFQIAVLGLMIFAPLCGAQPYVGSDGRGYIHFWSWRPPVYPIFIWLFHGFGEYQFVVTMWVQSFLVFVALLYARFWLHTYLNLSQFVTFLILSFTIIVDFLSSHILQWMYAESIAFFLFIFTFLLFVDNLKTFNSKKLIFMVIAGNLLILTRGQFICFYLLFLLIPILQFWNKKPKKQAIFTFLTIMISIVFFMLVDKSYHYFLHGQFRGISYVGRDLIVQPLYLADSTSARYFTDPDEKSTFIKLINKLEKRHLTRNTAPSPVMAKYSRISYDYFTNNYNLIDELFSQDIYPPEIADSDYQSDDLMFNIAKTLILNEPKANLTLYVWKITSYFATPWIFFAFLITLIAIVFRVLIDRDWQPSMKQLFIIASFLFILVNAIIVAIFQTYSPRYFYYTYFLFFCLSGLLANEFLQYRSAIKLEAMPESVKS